MPAPGPPVIAAAGDIACAAGDTVTAITCRQASTSGLLVGTGLSAVLPLGDIQNESGALSDFQASYAPTWGRVDAIAYPVLGNREYLAPAAQVATSTTSAPERAPHPGGYYSYDLGGWHLIALNSNCGFVVCSAGSDQERWLREDLAAHPATCQLAYWHHPLFDGSAGGGASEMTAIWQALDGAGVDVVLNGHEHHYERFAPQDAAGAADPGGPREFIVGTGGRSHGSRRRRPRPTANGATHDTFGVLRLTLRATGYDWRFVPEAGRSFTDAGSRDCR